MIDSATRAQNIAADPATSTWLSANAGSGKTRVLTNRVARLLLHGVQPQNILCLTYTKAAANEMQNRLFQTLGAWAMLNESDLRAALRELGEEPPENLAKARTLFASAIEAPGGLKVQTIHSLCSSILRLFPLEARISPQFRELDEHDQKQLISEVLDKIAEADATPIAQIARLTAEDLVTLASDVAKHAEEFTPPRTRDQICAAFGVPPNRSEADILAKAFKDDDLAFLKSLVPHFRSGKPSDVTLAGKIEALPNTLSADTLMDAAGFLLYGGGAKAPFAAKIGSLPTKDLRDSAEFQPLLPRLETIMTQVEAARGAWVNWSAANDTATLHDFANTFLPAYRQAKEDRGVLDFDDLIFKTRALLTDQTLPWVLYRLDSRIEHILVDEAQDTSLAQWDVIRALTEELTSGHAPDRPRTLFVVGDKKQSIYSFQGADAESFDRMARQFGHQLAGQLNHRELAYSFRSSVAILKSVDAVMGETDLHGEAGHLAFHPDLPGRVDLWPLEPVAEKPQEPEWYAPVDRPTPNDPEILLSHRIAREIEHLLKNETIPEKNGTVRPVRAGDIMILVQGRNGIFRHLIQACKALNLPIAGADRLKIAAELAVRDIIALLSFLALPEDDLSLAAALKSPLFGFTEKQLYDLAQGRVGKTLWEEIRRRKEDYPETHAALWALRDKVDFARPFELIEMILTRFDGRRKLVGHIGVEAEDGIDELLTQALVYENGTVPTLTGFLARFHVEDIEIKRQANGSDDLIRVMTVHGAKGLERPIVILPETTKSPNQRAGAMIVDDEGLPVFSLSSKLAPDRVIAAKERKKAADLSERNRLLYVAMTRAEKWLIVCGTEKEKGPKGSLNWHETIDTALRRAGGQDIETSIGPVLRLEHGAWGGGMTRKEVSETVTKPQVTPGYLSCSAPFIDTRTTVKSPSDLGGTKVLGGGAQNEEAAKRRGRQIHLLLEHLPGAHDPEDRARRLLSTGADRADPDELPELVNEALRNLSLHPDLFAADALAEVDVSAHLPQIGADISGTIDRLVIDQDRILAVDFKTNAIVPDLPEQTPEGILRQMGAYLAALEQIFPTTPIELAILWTSTCRLMGLPHGIVREALGRHTTS